MTVFLPEGRKTWRYDFVYAKKRYWGNTRQTTEADAELAEREIRLKLRHEAGGIAGFFPQETPRFDDWSKVFLYEWAKRLARPEHMQDVVPVLLRFFGKAPRGTTPTAKEPYHDLRLGDLIADSDWLLKFESWLLTRGLGPQSRNHYRGFVRRMYRLALEPAYRKVSGITRNPMLGVPSDQTFGRDVTVTPAQLRQWIGAASYHVRLAIAIGALVPKLRMTNILSLQWAEHFDPDPRTTKFNHRLTHYITVRHHKTARRTKRPLVTPVPLELMAILKDAHERQPRSEFVILYRGRPLKGITDGVKAAAEDAGLVYGRQFTDGVTFHTLRHTAATLLSEKQDDPLKLRDNMGHGDIRTTLGYRHRKPKRERPALDQLSKTLAIRGLVTAPRQRAIRKTASAGVVGKPAGREKQKGQKSNKTATRKKPPAKRKH